MRRGSLDVELGEGDNRKQGDHSRTRKSGHPKHGEEPTPGPTPGEQIEDDSRQKDCRVEDRIIGGRDK